MKLIFLIGKKRSGKDTTADYLDEHYNTKKFQLAGPIKDTLAYCWNPGLSKRAGVTLTRKEFEGDGYDREQVLLLNNEDVSDYMISCVSHLIFNKLKAADRQNGFFIKSNCSGIYETGVDKIERLINKNVEPWTVRRLMQTLGTDIVCNMVDRMYWLKLFSIDYLDSFHSDLDFYVVPDTRQDHELDAARAMGATVIHVVRPGNDSSKDTHITEAGLPIRAGDIVITNDGSLEDLYSEIEKVIK